MNKACINTACIQDMSARLPRCRRCGLLTQLSPGESGLVQSDVLYQDRDVCVLDPDSDRGIIVWHTFDPKFKDGIDKEGLVLGKGAKTGARSKQHNFHFFRAPMSLKIPQATLADMNSSYAHQVGANEIEESYFCIRVDPTQTFVYLSESRCSSAVRWQESRMSLQKLWDVIEKNSSSPLKSGMATTQYHILSGKKGYVAGHSQWFTPVPPERGAEILVACNIPAEWRVHPAV